MGIRFREVVMIYKDRGVPASLREARASDLKFAEKNALEMMSNLPFKSFNSDCIPDIMFERRSYCRDIPFLGVRRYYDTRGEETILSTIRSILATAPFEITLKVEKAESWVKCRPDSASVARGSQYFIQEAQSFKKYLDRYREEIIIMLAEKLHRGSLSCCGGAGDSYPSYFIAEDFKTPYDFNISTRDLVYCGDDPLLANRIDYKDLGLNELKTCEQVLGLSFALTDRLNSIFGLSEEGIDRSFAEYDGCVDHLSVRYPVTEENLADW